MYQVSEKVKRDCRKIGTGQQAMKYAKKVRVFYESGLLDSDEIEDIAKVIARSPAVMGMITESLTGFKS